MAAIITSAPPITGPVDLHRPRPRRTKGSARPGLRLVHGGAARPSPDVLRRRRAVAGLALAVVALLGLLGGRAALATLVDPVSGPARSSATTGETISVEVRPGDSLWSLTRRAQPEGDIRPVVDALSAARAGAPLQAGETLAIPAG